MMLFFVLVPDNRVRQLLEIIFIDVFIKYFIIVAERSQHKYLRILIICQPRVISGLPLKEVIFLVPSFRLIRKQVEQFFHREHIAKTYKNPQPIKPGVFIDKDKKQMTFLLQRVYR